MIMKNPYQLHIELTDNCNAACPMCDRIQDPIKNIHNLSLDNLKESIGDYRFKSINYCGNDGDPLMHKDFIEFVKFFSPAYQLIHTNGSMRNTEFWQELASIPNVIVIFGIDGVTQATHSKYRVNTKLDKILKNAETFNNAGGKSWWQFIVFEHNQHELDAAKWLADNLGFEKFEKLYSHRDSVNDIQTIQIEKENENNLECKSEKNQEIFVRADGEVFQCTYQAKRPKTTGININNNSLNEIIFNDYWKQFEFNDICNYFCKNKCGNKRVREVLTTGRDLKL